MSPAVPPITYTSYLSPADDPLGAGALAVVFAPPLAAVSSTLYFSSRRRVASRFAVSWLLNAPTCTKYAPWPCIEGAGLVAFGRVVVESFGTAALRVSAFRDGAGAAFSGPGVGAFSATGGFSGASGLSVAGGFSIAGAGEAGGA